MRIIVYNSIYYFVTLFRLAKRDLYKLSWAEWESQSTTRGIILLPFVRLAKRDLYKLSWSEWESQSTTRGIILLPPFD